MVNLMSISRVRWEDLSIWERERCDIVVWKEKSVDSRWCAPEVGLPPYTKFCGQWCTMKSTQRPASSSTGIDWRLISYVVKILKNGKHERMSRFGTLNL